MSMDATEMQMEAALREVDAKEAAAIQRAVRDRRGCWVRPYKGKGRGFGIRVLANGAVYKCQFVGGIANGNGMVAFPDDDELSAKATRVASRGGDARPRQDGVDGRFRL